MTKPKKKELTEDQLISICRTYTMMHMFDKPMSLIKERVFAEYKQHLERTYIEPVYTRPSKTDLEIKPTQGSWTRTASVERNTFAKDILQPKNKDGTINKHFVQAHGTKSLQKELKMSDRAIRDNAEKYG
jgi:hypothetical protein